MSALLNWPDKLTQNKISKFLLKLLPHIDQEDAVFCGSLAIKYHLKNHNIEFDYNREFNDLDALVSKITSIKPSIANDFLVYHYHDYSNKSGHTDDFFIALVDEKQKIKLDFFSYKPYVPFDPVKVQFEGHKLKIRNAEDQLATQIIESSWVFKGHKISPKWLENIEGLIKIADKDKVEKYYQGKGHNPTKENSAYNLYKKTKSYLEEHPEQIVDKITHREVYDCELCENKNGFIVEDMEKIYKLLGYVE